METNKTNNIGFQTLSPDNSKNEERRAQNFNTLRSLNLNEKTEKKNNLTYLTWSAAWSEFKKIYPSATFRVVRNPETNLPYIVDENLGIMVFTEVEADGLTYEMFLPVMDPSNKAMKLQPYTYQVWDYSNKKYIEKTVQAASMFDINKTIMRCLVKNLAMFGLGLYIYAGEDIPEQQNQEPEPGPIKRTTRKQALTPTQEPVVNDRYMGIRTALNNCQNLEQLVSLYKSHLLEVEGNPQVKELFTNRKNELAA